VLWIGLVSGTSADAVDAALVEIGDSADQLRLVAHLEHPLPRELREQLRALESRGSLRELLRLDLELGERFADAARAVAERAGVPLAGVEGIGSHGQTVAHYPEPGVQGSLQIASPSVIHARTDRPVVADFRKSDLAVGGQGAPLTPFLHRACLGDPLECRAVLNIGGFTNVTYLPAGGGRVVAFDPGPGNALLDRAAQWASKGRTSYDDKGRDAARGSVLGDVLEELFDDPYFEAPPPKSTGHEHFGAAFFERARDAVLERGGSAEDLQATLAALTVASVVAAARFFPTPPQRWIVYGGGTRNTALMTGLAAALAPAPVETTARYGIPCEALEAMAFALLGWCAARGIAANLPEATGAREAVVLGSLTPPRAF
jgi:anhydro-N-acetylmuramic acid kinase